jgi:hypothetical protein
MANQDGRNSPRRAWDVEGAMARVAGGSRERLVKALLAESEGYDAFPDEEHLGLDEIRVVRDADDLDAIPAHIRAHLDVCVFCQNSSAAFDPAASEVADFLARVPVSSENGYRAVRGSRTLVKKASGGKAFGIHKIKERKAVAHFVRSPVREKEAKPKSTGIAPRSNPKMR